MGEESFFVLGNLENLGSLGNASDENDESDKTTNTNTLPKCSSLPRLLVRLSACLLVLPKHPNLPNLPPPFARSYSTT